MCSTELKKATVEAICFSKRIEWAYEQEWRAITWRHGTDVLFGDFDFYPDELRSVTLGLKVNEQIEEDVRELVLARYPHCLLYRIQLHHGELSRVIA